MPKWAVFRKRMPSGLLRQWARRRLWLFLGSWLLTIWLGGAVPLGRQAIAALPSAPPPSETSVVSPLLVATDVVAADADAELSDIAAGVTAFDQGQTAQAIAHWQAALTQLDDATDDQALIRAYVLSNLATAYRQIGELNQAQIALEEGLAVIQSWADPSPTYWEVSARLRNTQGQSQWHQGQTQVALETWQQAEAHYRKAASATSSANSSTIGTAEEPAQLGLILSQVNQAIAYQELGFNAQAVGRLHQLSEQIVTLPVGIQLTVAKKLGKALRQVGELQSAQSVLSKALVLKGVVPESSLSGSTLRSDIELELGHTLRALSHRAIAIGQSNAANDYAQQAIDHYTAAEQTTDTRHSNRLVPIQAQLNRLSYLIEIGELESAIALSSRINLSALPLSRSTVEAYISYAHSLNCLQAPTTTPACMKKEWQEKSEGAGTTQPSGNPPQSQTRLIALLTTGLQQARALGNPVLESSVLGELGLTYELRGQTTDAITLTQQALSLLEGKKRPEVAYLWEWQLARLYQRSPTQAMASKSANALPAEQTSIAQENTAQNQAAIVAYQQALSSLAAVRQNLLLVDPQVQFSFRDNVEPVYREFISLLLHSVPAGAQPSQQALQLAVQTADALQLTELENFLGCNLSQLVSLSAAGSDPAAMTLHPIILPSQLAIIVDVPGQPLTLRTTLVSQRTVESTLETLRNNLTLPGKTPAVLTDAQALYSWLIEPIIPILNDNPQLQTLVFVPDGPLRNVPMGVLYDGEQYLVEKDYAIAIAPQLDLFTPRATPAQLKVLRGGIGLPQTVRGRTFPPIELIQAELNQIPEAFTVAKPLIDEDFTQSNIEQQLENETYSAIHWKTHGVFSSSPGETFLVAYQEGITANELSNLVQAATQRRAEPLELLVLSACATAQGDRRAVLGLAGIAVRAGTRSTLSTLWRADDGANTALMDSFYQGLDSGLTKAQALQKAQKMLLSESGYPAPYYWAPYVLVGNWL